jgi:hypothetical protein
MPIAQLSNDNLDKNTKILVLGYPNTLIVENILQNFKQVPLRIYMTGYINNFKQLGLIDTLYDEYKPEVIADLFGRKQVWENRALVVLEPQKNDKEYMSLMNSSLNFNMSVILLQHNYMTILPNTKRDLHWIFIIPIFDNCYKKRLYEQFGEIFKSYEVFSNHLDDCFINKSCLVIRNHCVDTELYNNVFYY